MIPWLLGAAQAADLPAWATAPAEVATAPVRPGLDVAELAPGDGEVARMGDLVVVEYVAWLGDGDAVWDSTFAHPPVAGVPAGATRWLLGDDRLVAAWSEGVVGMRAGGVRQLALSDPDHPEDASRKLVLAVHLREVHPPPEPSPPVARAFRPLGALRVLDLVVGDGPPVPDRGEVAVDYVLARTDGTPIDSSWRWPAPFVFDRSAPIRWGAALDGMHAGGRRAVWIPAAEAFGAVGRDDIPPGSDLLLFLDVHPR